VAERLKLENEWKEAFDLKHCECFIPRYIKVVIKLVFLEVKIITFFKFGTFPSFPPTPSTFNK
jgi:hypothetical protein